MKIKQIIPADNWYASYTNPNGIDHYSKLAFFALIDWDNDENEILLQKDIAVNEIEGFDSIEGHLECCKLKSNFDNYIYSEKFIEFPDDK